MRQFFMAAVLVIVLTEVAEAAIVFDKVPLLAYADSSVAVYDSPDGTRKGTISAGDNLVLVKEIRADGWAYGSYKITIQNTGQSRRVYRWFKMAELQGYADFENYTAQVPRDTNAYRTRTSTSLSGIVVGNEDLIVVAVRGDKVKTIFKADGEYYRMGWIRKTDFEANSDTNYYDDYKPDSLIYDDGYDDSDENYDYDDDK